ncbi:MAG: hypothetical protein JJU28_12340 [Cyclobacteriaceae bacterium]|nr:hypothetical protein [Cyclobacteriaceae bacterium]
MKTKILLSVMVCLIFTLPSVFAASPGDKLLYPVANEKKAKLKLAALPEDQYIKVRLRDQHNRLISEYTVKNTGQNWVKLNFNSLKTGDYSLDIILAKDDVVRKNMFVNHKGIKVHSAINLDREICFYDTWPLRLL